MAVPQYLPGTIPAEPPLPGPEYDRSRVSDQIAGNSVPVRQKWRKSSRLCYAALVTALLTGWAYYEWNHFGALQAESADTRATVDSVDRLLASLMDAESAQRGFLLTGNEEYLEPYNRAVRNISEELSAASRRLAAQPGQASNTVRLQALTQDKLTELRETVKLRQGNGLEAALAILQSGHDKHTMDQIRSVCAQIRNVGNATGQKDYAEVEAIAGTVLLASITGTLVLFFLFAFGLEPFASPDPQAWRRSWPSRYGAAVASVIAIALLRGALTPLIGRTNLPFTLFFCAVAFSAWFGGFQAAVLSIALALAAGSYFFAEPTGSLLVRDRDDQVAMLMMVVVGFGTALLSRSQRDAVDRAIRAENSERTRKQWFEITLASIGDAVIATDATGVMTFLNQAAVQLTGWSQGAVGSLLNKVFITLDSSTRTPLEDSMITTPTSESGMTFMNRKVLLSRDGREIPIEDSRSPIRDRDGNTLGLVVVFRDISERRAAEAERDRLAREVQEGELRLREAAKLESLGVLAGGIAHDFNNILVGVIGGASLALDMLPARDPARSVIQAVLDASEKAAVLTRQMLAYSGKGTFLVEVLDISRTVGEIIELLARSHPAVRVETQLNSGLPSVEVDRAQIQQVAINLILNAIEACSAGGSVTVSTTSDNLEPGEVNPEFGMPAPSPGLYVCLEVSDTGMGMTEDVRARIFDPFFSTKFTGRGLGLSAVLGIVRGHRGVIDVSTEVGRGTTFRVYLPASLKAVPETATETPLNSLQGSGTILVADDEEIVRRTARASLERCGYHVITVNNGEEAVEAFRKNPKRIDLVLLDLTMPVMGGEVALDEITKIDPSAKVLLSSGFSASEAAERFRGKRLCGFLQKPYTSAGLAEQVRSALVDDDDPKTRSSLK